MISFRRTILALASLMLSATLLSAQTPSTPATPIELVFHVTRSYEISVQNNVRATTLVGTINGEKVELTNYYGFKKSWVVKPGDYPARMTSEETTDGRLTRDYQVDLAPGKKVTFFLSSLGE